MVDARAVYAEASTEGLGDEAFDVWRESILSFYDPDPWRADLGPFSASGRGLLAADANFFVYRSRQTGGVRTTRQFRRDGNDEISIGLVFEGTRHHDLFDGDQTIQHARAFYAYDAARPSRVEWGDHAAAYLNLRRDDVARALGGPVEDAAMLTRRVSASTLAPFIRSHFELLAANMSTMGPVERDLALGQAKALVLCAMGEVAGDDRPADDDPSRGDALHAAALRFIEKNLSRPGLTAEKIAHGIGCSRATLYRIFEAHGRSVASCVTENRLTLARSMLLASNDVSNEMIAMRCGFGDVRSFYRAFRQRFGLSPGDMRAQARTAQG